MITKGMGDDGMITKGMGKVISAYLDIIKFITKITKEVLFDSDIS